MASTFDVATARTAFPALAGEAPPVFLDNAGGSQVLSSVASSIKQYLEQTNVQLGASYNVSRQSTKGYSDGLKAAAAYMGADPDETVIGPSTTQLFTNLSLILPRFLPGSEIILSSIDHEAHVSPWVRLATLIQPHLTIKWWSPPVTGKTADGASSEDHLDLYNNPIHTVESLKPLLTDRTVLVACTHTSNILGTINDIQAIGTLLQDSYSPSPTAQFKSSTKPFFSVDGVAYAPHRPVDMHGLFPAVDFYCFSWYKVFGPHIAVLYASRRSQHEGNLGTVCHYFHSEGKENTELGLETRLGLAGASYELVAAIPKVGEYIASLAGWEAIAEHEESLVAILLGYLHDHQTQYGITIFGSADTDRRQRLAVISFVVRGRSSRSIIEGIEKKTGGRIGCRYGHFYSKRLVDDVLGQGGDKDGVVRVSMVHYNTVEELEELVKVLDEVLAGR